MKAVYGHGLGSAEDKFANMAFRFAEEAFSSDAPGSHLTDVLPICEQISSARA